MNTILSVRELYLHFGQTSVLKNIHFDIEAGEIMGLVGESGSGKSVTSLAIMRLLDEQKAKLSGTILFEGKSMLDLSEEAMRTYRGRKIAMIFQEPMTSLNPVYTCGNQVAEALMLHEKLNKEQAKLRTIELFEEVQLPRAAQLFDAYPHQLSGGQRQRVMIAMALSCNPSLLIADEPTTALDVTVQQSIVDLLKKIRAERGMSMLFISHDLGLIANIADKVAVMYKGEILETGTAQQVFHHPVHPYTKGLIASRPDITKSVHRLATVSDFLQHNELPESNTITAAEVLARRTQLYSQAPLLKVDQLRTSFPTAKNFMGKATAFVHAVNDVSFAVYPGETLGLVGESGCGKTTLGRSVLRLIEAQSGSILYKDTDVMTLGAGAMRSLRKEMQIIFQDPYSSLNPRMRVGDAIMEPMIVHNIGKNNQERKEQVLYLLEKVGLLPEHYHRYPHEFSGGQRQRISIARALAMKPQFIICDESVSALDVSVQAQVLNLLADLRDEMGLTYLFISHDLAVVKHFCDRLLVMNKGSIVEDGYPVDVFQAPKESYTAGLVAAIPHIATLQ